MSDEPNTAEKLQRWADRMLEKTKPKRRPTREQRHFASIQDRLLASVIDMAILFFLFFEPLNALWRYLTGFIKPIPIESTSGWYGETDVAQSDMMRAIFTTNYAEVWVTYNMLMSLAFGVCMVLVWSRFHSSPGKWLMGVRLATEDGEGYPTTRDYIKRYAGFYLSIPVFLIGFFWGAFDKKHQAWHDKIAKTTVVYVPEGHIFKRSWLYLKRKWRERR
ncbi:MAG: hypothetical protein CMM93_06115 [Rickettsiales bacterium]|nr:hypothetical protein [Rickettsiales bacterium]|tara:strand:+ start:515 stop:1171 length:657 start_codon:yes stop_codon:yes gene_type:complete